MNVLLIWPYNPHGIEIPELFPLGLGYLLSNIDPKRHHVQIIDCTLDALSPESSDFEKKILDFNPDVIGISVVILESKVLRDAVTRLKNLVPHTSIVVGGAYANSSTWEVQSAPYPGV